MQESSIVIACEMLKDEIEYAYAKTGCTWPVKWVPRSLHNSPEKLREKLQEVIDQSQKYERILFTFGYCGGGTEGLYSEHSELIFVRCDDCIHMLLFSTEKKKSLIEKGVIYLTDGWIKDEQAILQQYEYMKKRYGEEICENVMHMMYGNYHKICVIDTEAYDMQFTQAYAKKAAEVLKLEEACCKGSVGILEQLLSEMESGQLLKIMPGQVVKQQDFRDKRQVNEDE